MNRMIALFALPLVLGAVAADEKPVVKTALRIIAQKNGGKPEIIVEPTLSTAFGDDHAFEITEVGGKTLIEVVIAAGKDTPDAEHTISAKVAPNIAAKLPLKIGESTSITLVNGNITFIVTASCERFGPTPAPAQDP